MNPIEGLELSDQLHDAVKYIHGTYQEAEVPELGEGEAIDTSIPADPNVKNYSYAIVDGQVYYRENSRMVRPDLNATAEARVKGLVGLRDCVQELIDLQMDAAVPDKMCIRDSIGVQFKAAATVSITYALMSRCGLEPERYFDYEDFMAIFDFNTPPTIGALGTAVSQINQQVLRQIGITVRNAEREANQERSKQDEQSHDLYPERRLSDSRPEAEPAAGETPGQVRQDEENLPEGTSSHPLQPDVAEREVVPAPSGDRRDRPEQTLSLIHISNNQEVTAYEE